MKKRLALLTAALLVPAALAVAMPSSASADSAWFVDPLTPAVRAAEIAVPNNPDSYRGPRKHTVATLRTRGGGLALPLASAPGHQLEAGQALVTTGKALFRFDSPTPTKAAKRQVRALAASLAGVRGLTCEGYADYGGPEGNEKDLGIDRARAICKIVRQVAPQVATDTVSYGGNRPAVVGGPSRVLRAQNRRVVLVVTNAGSGNRPPVANPDASSICLFSSGGELGNALTNDTDPDGDALVVTNPGVQRGTYGQLTLNANGTYSYSPLLVRTSAEVPTLVDQFSYAISDGHGGTASSTITVTVELSLCAG